MSQIHTLRIAAPFIIAVVAPAVAGCGGDSVTAPPDPTGRLAFIGQPADAVAGAAIEPEIRVEIRDAEGDRIGDAELAVTLALAANPGGATLMGDVTVTSENGVAVFSGVSLQTAAAGYTLAATASGLEPATSAPFTIEAAEATRLALLTQPGAAEGQVPFDPAVEVAIQDAFGNTVTDATAEVSVALVASPSGESLGGTTTATAADGVAVFDELSLSLAGDGFVLEATSDGLTPAASAEFGVRTTFVQVSGGHDHTCGITAADVAYCWGFNGSGQLGDGTTDGRLTPTPVSGGLSFAQVSSGASHTCGLTTDQVAYCWGGNARGQLGDGTTADRDTPSPVAGNLSFARITAGEVHTCGLTTGGTSYCWGRNIDGRLGDGTTTDRSAPKLVGGALTFAKISGGIDHTCGIDAGGIAYCWGGNASGQLGDNTTEDRALPTPVAADGLTFARIDAGREHTCGISTEGDAYCWGTNSSGQLGDGTTDDRLTPASVTGDLTFARVAASFSRTCGFDVDGSAYCWGANGDGQLGDGTTEGRIEPTPVAGGLSFSQIGPGSFHVCGITTDDIAYCWGDNIDGQLGDGTVDPRLVPTLVVQ